MRFSLCQIFSPFLQNISVGKIQLDHWSMHTIKRKNERAIKKDTQQYFTFTFHIYAVIPVIGINLYVYLLNFLQSLDCDDDVKFSAVV